MSKICKNCGNELAETAKFCNTCGTKYEEPVEEVASEQEVAAENEQTSEVVPEDNSEACPEEVAEETAEETVEPVEEAVEEPVEEVAEETAEEPVVEDAVPEEICEEDAAVEEQAEETEQENAEETEEAEEVEEESPVVPVVPDEKPKKKRRVTFGGVVGAILLAIFLIVNLVLGAGLSAAISVSNSDVSEFSITVDGVEYTVDSIVEESAKLDETGLFSIINSLMDTENGVELDIGGKIYEIKLDEEILSSFGFEITTTDEATESVCNALNLALRSMLVVFVIMAAYLVIVTYVNVYAIYSALGKTKRAHVFSSIIFLILGVAELVAAIISAFTPGVFGNEIVSGIASQAPVVASLFIISGVTGVFGCILFLAGIFGKNKD